MWTRVIFDRNEIVLLVVKLCAVVVTRPFYVVLRRRRTACRACAVLEAPVPTFGVPATVWAIRSISNERTLVDIITCATFAVFLKPEAEKAFASSGSGLINALVFTAEVVHFALVDVYALRLVGGRICVSRVAPTFE